MIEMAVFLFLTEQGAKTISWGESINDIITNQVMDSGIGNWHKMAP